MAIVRKNIHSTRPSAVGLAQDDTVCRISLIITTKNESRTISKLLDSIAKQTRKPDEVIIANAGQLPKPSLGSAKWIPDKTPRRRLYRDDNWADEVVIANAGSIENDPSTSLGMTKEVLGMTKVKYVELPADANRAVGRNTAIREATYDHILITDAGCVLKEDWVERMSAKFIGHRPQATGKGEKIAVAGFYEGEYQNIFEKCQIPYVLVMPDRLNPKDFLPATRSMGITRSAWEAVGGFNEHYRYAEDYDFARRLREAKIPIVTAPEAIVYWRPRQTLSSFARMIYEHAYGDAFAGNFRLKVLFIFVRYFIWGVLSLLWIVHRPQATGGGMQTIEPRYAGLFVLCTFLMYIVYSIKKNYRYIRHWKAILYLPLLQIVSDFSVMFGTVRGRITSCLDSCLRRNDKTL